MDRIKKTTDELQNMFYALSQQMYAQQPGQTPPEGSPGPEAGGPQTPPGKNDGDVIDGEVRDA
jgi:hypothetical protein